MSASNTLAFGTPPFETFTDSTMAGIRLIIPGGHGRAALARLLISCDT
jgi:hypothetical protein